MLANVHNVKEQVKIALLVLWIIVIIETVIIRYVHYKQIPIKQSIMSLCVQRVMIHVQNVKDLLITNVQNAKMDISSIL